MTLLELRRKGILSRLRCDDCGRVSTTCEGHGDIRVVGPAAVRSVTRYLLGTEGWATMPSLDEGQPVIIDLCPVCAEHVQSIL